MTSTSVALCTKEEKLKLPHRVAERIKSIIVFIHRYLAQCQTNTNSTTQQMLKAKEKELFKAIKFLLVHVCLAMPQIQSSELPGC